jgi:sodium-coupled neutral amino acid transporter 11
MNMEQRGRSSYLGASFNFVNSIVGAGIIGIPYAVSECGFFTGIMMLTFVAYLVNRSVLMLIECGIKARKYNFEDVSKHYLGTKGFYITLLFMFIFAYGAQVAYLVIVGDTIPVVSKILFHSSFTDRTAVVTLLAVFIILPLCFLKNLSSLSWTSMLSIFADTLLILILVVASPEEASREKIKPVFNFINSSLFAGIGTISFAFVCQHNCFLVFQSLTEQTYDNWKKVANLSVGFSFFLW